MGLQEARLLPQPQRAGGVVQLQQRELARGCLPFGLPQLPRNHPAGLSTGMKSSCHTACPQIKGSKGILAERAPLGSAWGTATSTQGQAQGQGTKGV